MRPQLEALESMALLSGVVAAFHHPHAHVPALDVGSQTSTTAIILQGTASGQYVTSQSNPDTGTQYNLSAFGQIGPLGLTIITGSFTTPGFIRSGTADGTLTLQAARGTLTLHITENVPGFFKGPFHFTYDIIQATGAFAGDTGSGTVDVTLDPFGSGAGELGPKGGHGLVTLTFNATPGSATGSGGMIL